MFLAVLYIPRELVLHFGLIPDTHHNYLDQVFKTFIPNFVMLFIIFGVSDKLCLMLGLYDEKRFEKLEESEDLLKPK